jgi:hypothetical protein
MAARATQTCARAPTPMRKSTVSCACASLAMNRMRKIVRHARPTPGAMVHDIILALPAHPGLAF